MKNILKTSYLNTFAFIAVIFVSLTIILIASLVVPKLGKEKGHPQSLVTSCPADYDESPLIVLSLDGFHPDYLKFGLTPHLEGLRKEGSSAPFMQSSFPTNTFPNHYSIVTGLYPESHGIIDSRFFDPGLNASFSRKANSLREGHWYGGDPIWNTVQRQGKKSATFYWVGSEADIGGSYPTYWKTFDPTIPYEARIDEALRWVSLPVTERPIWIGVYFDEPDRVGHKFGPNSSELKEKLKEIDLAIKRLTKGIEELGLSQCINLIIVSDHGMVDTGVKGLLPLETFMPDIDQVLDFSPKSYERFNITANSQDTLRRIQDVFSCSEQLRLYHKKDIPKRLHFAHNKRIHDFVFLYSEGVTPKIRSTKVRMGDHGYDNAYHSMKALFIGNGPAFQAGKRMEPFKNIELYNLMCQLVGVAPSPNNGTKGALFDALKDSSLVESTDQNGESETLPFPTEDEMNFRLKESFCQTELDQQKDVVAMLKAAYPDGLCNMSCSPLGLPFESKERFDIRILHHQDHATGFSLNLRIPVWVSFSIDGQLHEPYNESNWVTDVRIPSISAPNCTESNTMSADGHSYDLSPLFIPEFSKNSTLHSLTRLVSNRIPISSHLAEFWRHFLTNFLVTKAQKVGPVYVIIGPVFDGNSDSYLDQIVLPSGEHSTVPPSDMFAVVTWCRQETKDLHNCNESDLDTLSFIFPQHLYIETCFTYDDFIGNYMATLRDVEQVTGLAFFPNLENSIKLKLALRLPSL